MADETLDPITSVNPAQDNTSCRQLLECVLEQLRLDCARGPDLVNALVRLSENLEACFTARTSDTTYTDALERAPWLTSDAERLRQQRDGLRQLLSDICALANQGDERASESFARLFDEFVECYLDHEVAEHHFLHTAFHGPDGIENNDDLNDVHRHH